MPERDMRHEGGKAGLTSKAGDPREIPGAGVALEKSVSRPARSFEWLQSVHQASVELEQARRSLNRQPDDATAPPAAKYGQAQRSLPAEHIGHPVERRIEIAGAHELLGERDVRKAVCTQAKAL